jgi:diketogulonate reductase-like aldo/keto reductase
MSNFHISFLLVVMALVLLTLWRSTPSLPIPNAAKQRDIVATTKRDVLVNPKKRFERVEKQLQAVLSNGGRIPLVGTSMLGLQHKDVIDKVIQSNLGGDKKIYLLETSQEDENKHIIAASVKNLQQQNSTNKNRTTGKSSSSSKDAITQDLHILTKVMPTHLGAERTRLAVSHFLENLADVPNIRLHILLPAPRNCEGEYNLSRCEGDEKSLPQNVKNIGSPPHLHKDQAWKDSWRVLEDMVMEQTDQGNMKGKKTKSKSKSIIESIGVVDFSFENMQTLISESRIKPAIYQGSLIAYSDIKLMNLLHQNHVFFQANDLRHMLEKKKETRDAITQLTDIGHVISKRIGHGRTRNQVIDKMDTITEAMLVMAWSIQGGMGILTTPAISSTRRREQSPEAIAAVPTLTADEKSRVNDAISALSIALLAENADIAEEEQSILEMLLQSSDEESRVDHHDAHQHQHQHQKQNNTATAKFVNSYSKPIDVYWVDRDTGAEQKVIPAMQPNDSYSIDTFSGHKFVAYDTDMMIRSEFNVQVSRGLTESFYIGGNSNCEL